MDLFMILWNLCFFFFLLGSDSEEETERYKER